uniref:Acrosin-like n=1 Tax=Drosophila rhopaloa TaxID=1041015 RepID=A0A6P4F9B8_DRORH
MQTYFALLSLFGLLTGHQGTSFLLDKQCGHLNSARVVNGVNAGEKYAVWMAAIRNKSGFLCGGTLIHKPTVRPICIILNKETQQRLEYTAEQKFKAFGWGTTSDRLESEILQSITVDILDPTVCERNLLYTPVSEQICVGNPEGDTCRGDSGGPLSITVTINELFREVQHGIISVGARDCNNTSVLTRVSSYVDWIQGAINMNEDVNELPLRFESDVDEDKWLYKDCGGDTISSNLRAKITGRFFMAKGVLITN